MWSKILWVKLEVDDIFQPIIFLAHNNKLENKKLVSTNKIWWNFFEVERPTSFFSTKSMVKHTPQKTPPLLSTMRQFMGYKIIWVKWLSFHFQAELFLTSTRKVENKSWPQQKKIGGPISINWVFGVIIFDLSSNKIQLSLCCVFDQSEHTEYTSFIFEYIILFFDTT